MDEVTHANGDAHQDIRCDTALQGEQTKRVEIQCDFVLVHRQSSKPDGIILLASRAWEIVQVRPFSHQCHRKQQDGWHQFVRYFLYG